MKRCLAMLNQFSQLPASIQSGVIAGAIAILGIVLKDFVALHWSERRADKKKALEVYKSYADPIASATSSLFWRLREILVDGGRGDFLKSSGSTSPYDQYKFASTIYRLAALISWLRAYQREIAVFSLESSKGVKALRDAIDKFEAALADGAHVEVQRLKSVAVVWAVNLPDGEAEISNIAYSIEILLKAALEKNKAQVVSEFSESEQHRLCTGVYELLQGMLGVTPIGEDQFVESIPEIVHSLSIREAWLYRDFQSGIGDLFIRPTSRGNRQYDVIGYKDFEDLLNSDDANTKRWMFRLNRILDGLDISGADEYDARVWLLERAFLATIELIGVLTKIDERNCPISPDAVQKGYILLNDQSWRRSVDR